LATAKAKADHIDIYYNNGHAGVPDPHYRIVLVTNANMEELGVMPPQPALCPAYLGPFPLAKSVRLLAEGKIDASFPQSQDLQEQPTGDVAINSLHVSS
jgi:hypothetical protein